MIAAARLITAVTRLIIFSSSTSAPPFYGFIISLLRLFVNTFYQTSWYIRLIFYKQKDSIALSCVVKSSPKGGVKMEQHPNGENPHFTRDNATSVPKEKVEKAKEEAKQVQQQQKNK